MQDTGLAVQLSGAPALPLLDALAAGELDVGLCNTPAAEGRLDGQGLVHDRQLIASGEFVLVGPPKPINAALRLAKGEVRGAGAALRWLHESAQAQAESIVFFSANDGSGAHVAEQEAWRAAQLAPQAPWYQPAQAGRSLIAQTREKGAYAIVERGAWIAQGGAPLAILVEGDRGLTENDSCDALVPLAASGRQDVRGVDRRATRPGGRRGPARLPHPGRLTPVGPALTAAARPTRPACFGHSARRCPSRC